VAKTGQWENSVHATGGNFERNSSPCANCHTSEGFVAFVANGDGGTPADPTPVGCFACHEPHTNHNFDLRTMAAVTLELGGTFDRGEGNLCANCHHGRAPSPALPAAGDSLTITSSRWGPHHGPQADILNGTGAYVFAGQTYRNSPHTTLVTEGCPSCHMADAYGFQAGGHSMNLTYDYHGSERELVVGCNAGTACHTGLTTFNYDALQDSVEVLIGALQTVLIADSLLSESTGLLNVPTGGSLRLSDVQAGAAFNFLLFEGDRSLGVHNSKYTIDALNASISALAGR
jgi:hypothetical protein